MSIPNHTLSNGFTMPSVGLGTYKEENPEKLVVAVKAAIAAGYRHFDCAYCYNNEHIIGKAIREAIEESNGSLKREDLFITSKCWNAFHSKEAVAKHIDDCLKKFGFDYLDLFLMHWPFGFKVISSFTYYYILIASSLMNILFGILKENAGDFPMGENGKPLLSDVHFTETYKVSEISCILHLSSF